LLQYFETQNKECPNENFYSTIDRVVI